jgi:CBS domain containing-hemolysin-like protein
LTALEIIAALGLVCANSFFVASEFAITRSRPTQVNDWVKDGRAGARSVEHAVTHIDAYLAACQLGITLASLGLGVVGERAFHHLFEDLFGEGAEVVGIGFAGLLAFGVITLLHVVVGELAPKSAAISRTGPVVRALAPPMRAFYMVTKPLVDFFNGLGNLLLKPFGIPPASEAGHAPHSEDELRTLVRQSQHEGLIEPEEGTFADNVLTFGDRRAREVMVPRREVKSVSADMSRDQVIDMVRETGLTRLPVSEAGGGLDTAIGVVHAKDLLVSDPAEKLRSILRPLERVPESLLIDELLEQLRSRREHVALVSDEHGTVIGLVTLEDVLEEIVGEIEDEFDPQAEEPLRREGGTLFISGAAPVRVVAEALQVEIEDAHEATIGGYLMEREGRLPRVGEALDLSGKALDVMRISETQIEELQTPSPAGGETTAQREERSEENSAKGTSSQDGE